MRTEPVGTRAALLRETERLLRTRGYRGFSFADLADAVGIRKPTVHHHFASKEALGNALVADYLLRFECVLSEIEVTNATAIDRLRAYAAIFESSFEEGLLPLCCALAVERCSLPQSMQLQVRDFFRLHLNWLTRVIEDGVPDRRFANGKTADRFAVSLLSALEGGSITSWALQENTSIKLAFEDAITAIAQ